MEKSMLPVDGKPVIRYIFDNLRKSKNIGKICICCLNRFAKQFRHEFRDTDVDFIFFPEPLGTARTVMAINGNEDEYIMIHYADCMTDINYDEFIKNCDFQKYDGIIAVTDTVKSDYGEVIIGHNKVFQFNEKPVLPYHTWSGILVINKKKLRQIWNEIDGDKLDYNDIAYNIFPAMVCKEKLGAYNYGGFWADVGNLNSYRKMCEKYNH